MGQTQQRTDKNQTKTPAEQKIKMSNLIFTPEVSKIYMRGKKCKGIKQEITVLSAP